MTVYKADMHGLFCFLQGSLKCYLAISTDGKGGFLGTNPFSPQNLEAHRGPVAPARFHG